MSKKTIITMARCQDGTYRVHFIRQTDSLEGALRFFACLRDLFEDDKDVTIIDDIVYAE